MLLLVCRLIDKRFHPLTFFVVKLRLKDGGYHIFVICSVHCQDSDGHYLINGHAPSVGLDGGQTALRGAGMLLHSSRREVCYVFACVKG